MDALFNNAGLSYLPSACKIVFIKCWTVQNNISTMSHLRWFACPGWPAAAARGPTSRPGAGPSLQLLSSPGVTPGLLSSILTRAQPHCDHSSEGLLRAGSCNANFLFILFCVTFIALAFSPRLTIRYLFCQHTRFYCYKCRDTQVWIVWKMKQYFPKLLKTFC